MDERSLWLLSALICTLPEFLTRPYAREIAFVALPPPVRGMCTNARMGFQGCGASALRTTTLAESCAALGAMAIGSRYESKAAPAREDSVEESPPGHPTPAWSGPRPPARRAADG